MVEGYEDVAFWRGIFDRYESDKVTFEITVPLRKDLAKGKKTLLGQADKCGPNTILCMDSDFDYLFADQTEQAAEINSSPFMFHTYVYSTENYICYAPSLHNICVKATKNDTKIFDFEEFLADYSRTIYPAFLWYAYSAQSGMQRAFTLLDFKSTVRIGYLDTERNGADTIAWLGRQVARRVVSLAEQYPQMAERMPAFERALLSRGVTPDNVYLFMHGHTLMDNVVMVALNAVCDKLRLMAGNKINNSAREGLSLANELSNYNNSLCNVRDALLFNENYKQCFLYKKLQSDIEQFLEITG
ncbi:MAG: DUF4435 domain-containing protein [Tidjanibacter sp.]|nr:DUF4435 domain-containing protein [Tidjanibacter sp.]